MINSLDPCCFWVRDGKILRNLKDLEWALREISEETFNHHVGENRNDFAKWTVEVLLDLDLSQAMQKAKNRKEMVKLVQAALKNYEEFLNS